MTHDSLVVNCSYKFAKIKTKLIIYEIQNTEVRSHSATFIRPNVFFYHNSWLRWTMPKLKSSSKAADMWGTNTKTVSCQSHITMIHFPLSVDYNWLRLSKFHGVLPANRLHHNVLLHEVRERAIPIFMAQLHEKSVFSAGHPGTSPMTPLWKIFPFFRARPPRGTWGRDLWR